MAKAGAQIEISASSSRLASGLSRAMSQFAEFGKGAGRMIGRGIGAGMKGLSKLKLGEIGKSAIGNFGGDLLGRGMDAVFDAGREVRQFESDMQRLGVTTKKNPAAMLEFRNSLMQVSAATGINREQLSAASALYFDLTSDADGMAKSIGALARVSQASGAGMEELVKTSAAMKDSMGIGPEQMEAMFSGLIAQGEAGKITLRELASEAPALMAMFSKFNTGAAGVMQMNAAFQVGAKAFGSASQAATGLEAMMGMLQARSGKIKSLVGVSVFEKDGRTLRNLQDIVGDIAKKSPKQSQWGKIFGENKEGRAFLEMLMKYPDLYKEIVAAGSQAGLVQEYATERATSAAGRLDIAMNKMKLSVAEAFTPERIEGFIRGIETAAQKIGPLVDGVGWIADKLGSLVGAGKAIRGFLDKSHNPWNETFNQDAFQSAGKGYILGGDNSPAAMRARAELANRRLANRDSFESTSEKILAAEVNDRSSPASLRAAMFAASGDKTGMGGGGEFVAGTSYLRGAGTTLKAEQEKYGAEMKKIMDDGLAKIASAIAAAAPQIGDDQVARSATKATNVRRSTQ